MKLSICMMVKNEEKNLERCLMSLKHIMSRVESELIIIDTGSTDSTVEIAKRYTDQVYFHAWNNHFSEMRNISISYAKGEWLFLIDADEELESDSGLIEFLRKGDHKKYSGAAIYLRNIKNYHSKEYTTELVSPRLFKNGIGFKFEGSVHNLPIISGELLFVEDIINHYGYISEDLELMERKFIRTKTLLEKELEQNPDNLYYIYQLATSYAMHGDALDAYTLSKRAFEKFKVLDSDQYKYLFLVSAYAKDALNLQRFDESVEASKIGLKLESDFIDLYYFAATAYIQMSQIDEAIDMYLGYLKKHDSFDTSPFKFNSSIQHYTLHHKEEVYCNLSIAYLQKEEFEKAFAYSNFVVNRENINSLYFNNAIKAYIYSCISLKKYDLIVDLFGFGEVSVDYLIECVETGRKTYLKEEDSKIYETLSKLNNSYGVWNRFKLDPDDFQWTDDNREIMFGEIAKGNFEALYYMIKYLQPASKLSFMVDDVKMMSLFGLIDDCYKDFSQVVKNYVSKFENDHTIISLNWLKSLYKYIFVKSIQQNDAWKNFDAYISLGIEFIEKKYSADFLTDQYFNGFLNSEEQLFLSLKLLLETSQLYYYDLAVGLYRDYKTVIVKWIDNKINQNQVNNNSEIEILKKQFKENIYQLLDSKKLEDAIILVSEYLTLFPQDFEIILLQSELMLLN